MAEVVASLRVHVGQHFYNGVLVFGIAPYNRDRFAARRLLFLCIDVVRLRNFRRQSHGVFVSNELEKFRCHLLNRQHPVHHPGADCAGRHTVVFGFVRVLGNRKAALSPDMFQPNHAI